MARNEKRGGALGEAAVFKTVAGMGKWRARMSELRYGFVTQLSGTTFEQALERVTVSLKNEGFGVLTEIDIKDTLKKKLGVDFRRYVILGACNPTLAHRALEADPYIGLLLPCNVVVQETANGGVTVSIADPRAMFALVDNADVTPVAEEADTRLRRVFDALATTPESRQRHTSKENR